MYKISNAYTSDSHSILYFSPVLYSDAQRCNVCGIKCNISKL